MSNSSEIRIWKNAFHIPHEFSVWCDAKGQKIVSNMNVMWLHVYFDSLPDSSLETKIIAPVSLQFTLRITKIDMQKILKSLNIKNGTSNKTNSAAI